MISNTSSELVSAGLGLDPEEEGKSTGISIHVDELAVRMKARDETSLVALHKYGQCLLKALIQKILHNEAETEDVYNEVLQECWEKIDAYDPAKGSLTSWIISMTRRRAIDRLRKRQAYQRLEERVLEMSLKELPPQRHGYERPDGIPSECYERLMELVCSVYIPEEQRECLLLAHFEGYSQRDIALKTGIPLGTIKTRLELGLKKFTELILDDPIMNEWAFS